MRSSLELQVDQHAAQTGTEPTRRVSHSACCPAQQSNRPVATALEPLEDQDAQQVSQMQAISSRIKATIKGEGLLCCCIFKRIIGNILRTCLTFIC